MARHRICSSVQLKLTKKWLIEALISLQKVWVKSLTFLLKKFPFQGYSKYVKYFTGSNYTFKRIFIFILQYLQLMNKPSCFGIFCSFFSELKLSLIVVQISSPNCSRPSRPDKKLNKVLNTIFSLCSNINNNIKHLLARN